MVHLVAGLGEVGSAVQKIFGCSGFDIDRPCYVAKCDYLHVCIPYSRNFVKIVKQFQEKYEPEYTIIHSTVKPGTCSKLGAVSSPVLGIHPNLVEGIRTFTKFLGGKGADIVADEFRRRGIKVYVFDKSETTEIMKILDTTFYGLCIEYTKNVKKVTQVWDIPFEAWTLWTSNYNEGYIKLGHPEYVRPNLVPIMTEIRGHCVKPNLELMNTQFTRFLKKI